MRVSGSSMNVRKVAADTTIKTHDNKRFNLRKGDYTMFYSPIMHLDSEVHKESEVSALLGKKFSGNDR